MNNNTSEKFVINRSTYFDNLENRESEFDFSNCKNGQFEIAKQRILAKIDLIASRLPPGKAQVFQIFQRSFIASEKDLSVVFEIDGGNYSISEILVHIEKRLTDPSALALKPGIDTWLDALTKNIY